MADSLFRPMINLGNSIVGVSIVTMPWCFSQCGVVLGTILLLLSAMFTVWTCKMLLRAANMTRQHSYETLGLAVYGSVGKLAIELSNIGLTMGCCVAFFVIIGDLLPPLVAHVLGISWDPVTLRAVLLVSSAVCVAFPLTLIRNVDRLSVISVGSLVFYLFLILQLIYTSKTNLMGGKVWSNVVLWRNMGVLKCLPIFSLAFCCQTQMFVIYASLHDGSVRKMSTVVCGAIAMVAIGYLMVAVFGYVTYCTLEIKGDVLSNFPVDLVSQLTRFGFSFTVMLSFPLMVFPCRVSINSLLFQTGSMELHVQPPIPQGRFVAITSVIMASTLTVAVLVPNIQTVLGLVGATLGSLICFIYPGALFTKVAGSNTDYTTKAKACLAIGFCVLVLSTMVTLNSWTDESSPHYHIRPANEPDIVKLPPVINPPDQSELKHNVDSNEIDKHLENEKHEDKKNDALQKEVNLDVPFDAGEKPAVLIDNVDSAKDPEAINEVPGKEKKEEHVKLVENISKLAERVEKLEEENKDLRERQDEVEKVKGEDEIEKVKGEDELDKVKGQDKFENVKGQDKTKPLIDFDKGRKVDEVKDNLSEHHKPEDGHEPAVENNEQHHIKRDVVDEEKVDVPQNENELNLKDDVVELEMEGNIANPIDPDLDSHLDDNPLITEKVVSVKESHHINGRDLKSFSWTLSDA